MHEILNEINNENRYIPNTKMSALFKNMLEKFPRFKACMVVVAQGLCFLCLIKTSTQVRNNYACTHSNVHTNCILECIHNIV